MYYLLVGPKLESSLVAQGFPGGSDGKKIKKKNPPEMQETWVQSRGWEDSLEDGMETHSSILAWRVPWTEEPGGLPSMGSHRVGYDWSDLAAAAAAAWYLNNILTNKDNYIYVDEKQGFELIFQFPLQWLPKFFNDFWWAYFWLCLITLSSLS